MKTELVTNKDNLFVLTEPLKQHWRVHVALVVSMENETWGYALRYAAGHLFLPVLIILSRLFRREIRW